MKIMLLLFCTFLSYINVFSQEEQDIDLRLKQVFSEEYLNNLSQNYPSELEYLNWCLDNSYYIISDLDIEKYESLPYLKYYNSDTKTIGSIVEDIEVGSINIFLYSFEINYNSGSMYRIGNSGKTIYFYSNEYLSATFNKK